MSSCNQTPGDIYWRYNTWHVSRMDQMKNLGAGALSNEQIFQIREDIRTLRVSQNPEGNILVLPDSVGTGGTIDAIVQYVGSEYASAPGAVV